MAEVPAVELNNVSFAYGNEPVLAAVNLVILPREFISIVGPNGGGKTTLLRLVLGLLRPQAGQVLVFGQAPAQARLLVGYVPQHARLDLQFPVTVLDVVLMGRVGHTGWGPYRRADRAAALAALTQLDLADLGQRSFSALSGGQRQRVLIARALASEPQVLLLDEPMANVDSLAQQRLHEILQRLHTQMAVVMVSHDLGVVSQLVSRVVCVNRQVQVHPTSELTGEVIRELYHGDVALVRHDHHEDPPA